jgi:molybdate-binding protein
LHADEAGIAADGIVARSGRKRTQVELLAPLQQARGNLVLAGCALALGLLADRLNAQAGAGRFLWLSRSSGAALGLLAARHTHIAGVHLVDSRTGEANVPDVRRAACADPVVLVTLARWQAGLVMRTGDARTIRSAADLGRPRLRLVTREAGAGAQRLLERELRRAGHARALLQRSQLTALGHLDVARSVARGAADVGVATRDVALAFGLHFVPLAEERYDLALPRALLPDARVQRLLNVVTSSGFRRELSALEYDASSSGQQVAEIRVA